MNYFKLLTTASMIIATAIPNQGCVDMNPNSNYTISSTEKYEQAKRPNNVDSGVPFPIIENQPQEPTHHEEEESPNVRTISSEISCDVAKKTNLFAYSYYKEDEIASPLEKTIEKNFDIEIRGKTTLKTDEKLLDLKTALEMFPQSQISKLTFILGDSGMIGKYIGSYHAIHTLDGAPKKDCPGIIFTLDPSDINTTIHEIIHHTHHIAKQRSTFNKKWESIPTIVRDIAGYEHAVQNSTARQIYNMTIKMMDDVPLDGNYGFTKAYSSANLLEDIATLAHLVSSGLKGGPLIGERISYWDINFDATPYLAKIDLAEEYGILPPLLANIARKRLLEGDEHFAKVRTNGMYFSPLTCEISFLGTMKQLPSTLTTMYECPTTLYKLGPKSTLLASLCKDAPDVYSGKLELQVNIEGYTIIAASPSISITAESGFTIKPGYQGLYIPPVAFVTGCGEPGDDVQTFIYKVLSTPQGLENRVELWKKNASKQSI